MQCLSDDSALPPDRSTQSQHQPVCSLLRLTFVDFCRKNVGNHEIWGNGLDKTCKDWTRLPHLELLDYKPASGFLYSFSDLRSSFILPAYIHIDNSQNVWILENFQLPTLTKWFLWNLQNFVAEGWPTECVYFLKVTRNVTHFKTWLDLVIYSSLAYILHEGIQCDVRLAPVWRRVTSLPCCPLGLSAPLHSPRLQSRAAYFYLNDQDSVIPCITKLILHTFCPPWGIE